MGIIEICLIALGLSMDALAVSVSNGLAYQCGKKQMFMMAGAFGLFQAIMPLIGYLAGKAFFDIISAYDHWIALGLLAVIGIKMIIDGIRDIKKKDEESACEKKLLTVRMLLLQAVATSIDALAVGISFAVLTVNMFAALPIIGVTTFGLSLVGSFAGKKFGGVIKNGAEITGGVILVLIGVKIFLEHMLAL